MKTNPDKCHVTANCDNKMSICVNNRNLTNNKCENLLGIKIDHKLNFNTHIDEICTKAGQRLNALSRVTPYMDLPKRRVHSSCFNLVTRLFCKKFIFLPEPQFS